MASFIEAIFLNDIFYELIIQFYSVDYNTKETMEYIKEIKLDIIKKIS